MSLAEEKKGKKGKKRLPEPEMSILSEGKSAKTKKSLEKEIKDSKEKIHNVKAQAKFLKISYKKVRPVIDAVRGMLVNNALDKLFFIKKKAAPLVIKLLNSAMANAENNFKLNKEDLYIKEIFADEGPTLHRWMPKAHGRAAPIQKRTTHLSVFLGLKEEMAKESSGIKKSAGKKDKLIKKGKSVSAKTFINGKKAILKKKPEHKSEKETEISLKKEESIL